MILAPNANMVFSDISASATCEEVCFLGGDVLDAIDLKYLPAKWRIFLKGDTTDPKRVAALSELNLNDEGKTTQAAYFRALLQQMAVPGNVDAINRVLTNTNTDTDANTNTNTKADKEHANKSGTPNSNRLKP